MAFESLTQRLQDVFKHIRGKRNYQNQMSKK